MTTPESAVPRSPVSRRASLLALLIAGCAPSIGTAAAFFLAPGAVGNLVYAVCKGVLYGTPLVWVRFVSREPLSFSRPRRGGLAMGILTGLALGAVVLATYWFWARDALDPAALRTAASESGFDTPGRYLLVALWLCTGNAVLEEYAFRWFIYGRCAALMSARVAVWAAAAIFTAHHVLVLAAFFDGPIVALGSAGVFVGGLTWTWCYKRYGSIWPGYLSHALVDVAILVVGWDLLFGP